MPHEIPPTWKRFAAAAAAAALLAGTAYSQPAVFADDPSWESGPANLTRAVALGDVDRDGRLDLVAGNLGQANALFGGIDPYFTTGSLWNGGAAATFSIAFGDVDGDGYTDVVCGNAGGNTLYLNTGGGLSPAPVWTSARTATTTGLVLADIDGNGTLDLLCADGPDGVCYYRNIGGAFEEPPAWSNTRNATRGVGVGDVDGDGDLDLACGNVLEPNTVYVNSGGILSPSPSWESDSTLSTRALRLADLDGDGRLDLICANDETNTAYYNVGTTLDTIPVWVSNPSNLNLSLDVGDVDHDGDLDVVFGTDGGANTLYLNGGGVFPPDPSWSSGRSSNTTSVALADADGDGDLDLVCGNTNETNTVYENQSPPFAGLPDWKSAETDNTLGVALGDVSGDGRVDLVCGNLGSNKAYRNDATTFETTSMWQSGPSVLTAGVDVGDVNGDGDGDVVAGNVGANELYLSAGGQLPSFANWSSNFSNVTSDLALGDIDGDGQIDLVCANTSGVNTLYLNQSGTFAGDTAWSAPTGQATDVALADVDGDGDLDAVFSNTNGRANTLHLNDAGTLSRAPDWWSNALNTSSSVAIGDVDGDGIVDAAFGNVNQANTLYLGGGGTFATTPIWSSAPTQSTGSVALGDIDGDGDLDLVCGNLSQANAVYLNDGGALRAFPDWETSWEAETEDVVLGDIDGDGDLDLVFGNEPGGTPPATGANTAYLGRKNPPFVSDPANPTNQQANNASFVASADVVETAPNLRRVRFSLVDVESDPVYLAVEYQFEGEHRWRFAEVGAPGAAGPFATSPGGTTDSLMWDVSLLPFDPRGVVVRLKAIEVPARVGAVQHAPSFVRRLGKVVPTRPEISSSPSGLVFPTVTVGDTASLAIAVTNSGNVDLELNSVMLPSSEMRLADQVLPAIPPGESSDLVVFLEPVQDQSAGGFIEILSNDPVTPIDSVAVVTDVRALDVTTRLLTGSATIPLGEAATVIVEPFPDVRVERGDLLYRSVGGAGFQSTPLGRSGSDFVAVIPGPAVTEGGIEYYVQVHNSSVVSTDPEGAPLDTVFFQAVEPPEWLSTSPRPTLGQDFLEGNAIRVDVGLPRGAQFQAGTLYYREGGSGTFASRPLELVDGVPAATIPGDTAGSRGVEYWAEATTSTATLTEHGVGRGTPPVSVQVLVPNLVEPTSHPGHSYRLFSIPLAMRGSILGALADEFGGKDETRWRLWLYDPSSGGYVELPRTGEREFTQGKAYWLIALENHRIGTGDDDGFTAATDGMFAITLEPGHNLVGIPFDFPVAWDSCFVDTLSTLDPRTASVVQPPVGYVVGQGYQFDVGTLVPFDGYWVNNLTAAPVVLRIPAIAEDGGGMRAAPIESETGWHITVTVSANEAVAGTAVVGVADGAADEWDAFDRAMPPLVPGRSLGVCVTNPNWEERPGRYARDLRSIAAIDGRVWSLDVAKSFADESGGDNTTMSVAGFDGLPGGARAVLIDRKLGRTVDLLEQTVYRFYLGRRAAEAGDQKGRFAIVVGNEEFVATQVASMAMPPEHTELHQNRPNPFNPSTVVRYDLAEPGTVSLRVYDVRGSLVRVLEQRERGAGRYEAGWDGRNDQGARVASGVYFYRLVVGRFAATRKMLLLK
jgi:hypothetical protein